MLDSDVMSNHSNPRMYWQPMSLDTEALLAASVPPHLYTMPGTGSVHTALDLEGTLEVSERFAQPLRRWRNPIAVSTTARGATSRSCPAHLIVFSKLCLNGDNGVKIIMTE